LAVDFQFDATTDGRWVKIASIIERAHYECLGGLVLLAARSGIRTLRPVFVLCLRAHSRVGCEE
jgi:hypothetical protein